MDELNMVLGDNEMSKKIFKIERVLELLNEIKEINQCNLENIIWTKDSIAIDIPLAVIEDFAYMGLNNIDFILSEFYLENGLNETTK